MALCSRMVQYSSSRDAGPSAAGQGRPASGRLPQLPADGGVVRVGVGSELLVRLRLGAHNVHPIILSLAEAGRARTGQQDELCEAVKVRHAAETLQHEHHDDQAQEEVGCGDGEGAMGGLRPAGQGPPTETLQGKAVPPFPAPALPLVPGPPPRSPVTSTL